MSQEDALASYSSYLQKIRKLSPHSIRAQKNDLEAFSRWLHKKEIPLLKAGKHDVRSYLAYLVQAGYTHTTQARALSTIKSFFSWAVHEQLLDLNPAEAITAHKRERKLPQIFTQQDLVQLFSAIEKSKKRAPLKRAFLELLYASGARISEISALNVEDVNFCEGLIKLFGKGSKERIVPVYPEAIKSLRLYLSNRPKPAATHALFLSEKGTRLSSDSLRYLFKQCIQEAGLSPSYTPHTMRHTYATALLNGGAGLRSVQELLGHVSLSTTQIYTHLSLKEIREVSKRAHPRSGTQD